MKIECCVCHKMVDLSSIVIVGKHEYCVCCVEAVKQSIRDSRITLENALKTALEQSSSINTLHDNDTAL
jgi:hypothetical protein